MAGKISSKILGYVYYQFLFSILKTCFWEYKEKTIFLYFLNQKHVWLVEIKKIGF